jgi:hypothetical protein
VSRSPAVIPSVLRLTHHGGPDHQQLARQPVAPRPSLAQWFPCSRCAEDWQPDIRRCDSLWSPDLNLQRRPREWRNHFLVEHVGNSTGPESAFRSMSMRVCCGDKNRTQKTQNPHCCLATILYFPDFQTCRNAVKIYEKLIAPLIAKVPN